MVAAGDIPLAPLVVIQVTPAGEVAGVEDASGQALRGFCHDVADLAPGHVVLGIPRLPPPDAVAVAGAIAKRIDELDRPPQISNLLDMLSERGALVGGLDRPRVAYEFCLVSTVRP